MKLKIQKIKAHLKSSYGNLTYFSLKKLNQLGFSHVDRLPFSIKILLENTLRSVELSQDASSDVEALANWSPHSQHAKEIAFRPGRVILQDFTGVPCVVDLAAMRDAMKQLGGDYREINPQIPCDLIIDHSVQTDCYATKQAFQKNLAKEFQRNKERYQFLKWGQSTLKNFRVVPPAMGIIHQINLEYLAKGILEKKEKKQRVIYPDSVIGTDSHTTMINGLGVIGWGVGGIEAEAAMLGEPLTMLMPEVFGIHLKGKLSCGIMPTDLALTIVEILRTHGVVGKFIEYFGEGIQSLTLANRAMIANMTPEYGATIGLFPIDQETIRYYRKTGRRKNQIDLLEQYCKQQGMFYQENSPIAHYTKIIEIDLSKICLSVAGPKRPQDRINLSHVKTHFFKRSQIQSIKDPSKLQNGSVVIASITSCTNTSDPFVLIAAGLLAKNAVQKGLNVKPFVKTSFAPGSRVVIEYLKNLGLLPYLEKLGFHLTGYGCMTCIGNSGPLIASVQKAIRDQNLIVSSVLSGNRNFEGRINPWVKENFLASPPLVVAYALAGNIGIDLTCEPIGKDKTGQGVFLSDLWPSDQEINQLIHKGVRSKIFKKIYKNILNGTTEWKKIKSAKSDLYVWNKNSSYVRRPPFFESIKETRGSTKDIVDARILAVLGDSVTTDHISPAGAIAKESPAGKYLISLGVTEKNFNSYGSRRGNDEVMTRGTFANIRLRNQLVKDIEGGWTRYFPTNERMTIFHAATLYQKTRTPLIIFAGKEYGTGSSRDWAAKGTALLGVKAIVAQSFERIHRSNLIGMGVLPLEFIDNESYDSLNLKGDEVFNVQGLNDRMTPGQKVFVQTRNSHGIKKEFCVKLRLDTPGEITYYRNGGILQTVLYRFDQPKKEEKDERT